jgi:hypothetical protein
MRTRPVTAIALGALVALALAACGGGKPQPAAADIVAQAIKATQAEKAFHFVFDEKEGPRSTTGLHLSFAEGDVVVPDKIQADVSGTLLGVPLRSQLIVVSGRYFVQDPLSGKWQEVSVKTNPVAFFDPAKGVLAVIKGAKNVEVVGSEKVAGVDAYHLKGKAPLSAITPILGNTPGPRLVDVELWVDKATDRLARLRLVGRVQEGDSAATERTVEITKYGVVVPIAPPKL